MMKSTMLLVSALFLLSAASGVAYADDPFTYADQVIATDPTSMGAPNHAPSMNMNWLNSPPCTGYPFHSDPMYPGEPFTNPDRLKAQPDGWAVGWGPGSGSVPWTGTANAIVRTATPFTHDGIIAQHGEQVAHDIGSPDGYNVSATREGLLADMGYDVVIYGLGYGFDEGFKSHGMVRVWVAEELSSNIDDWSLVSSWTGNQDGTEGVDYFENRDGTYTFGAAFNNGGFSGLPRTFMVIDLDNPDIIDPATGENMGMAALTGTYNYIWFEGGFHEDNGETHGNANFLDAFAAHPAPVAIPAFSPEPGTYTTAQNVIISCDSDGAVIHYTTDGTDPTESSTEYSGPVTISTTTTLKARAFKSGWDPNQIASGLYTIAGTTAIPSFAPPSGTDFTSSLDIEISCSTEGATIYYTKDNTDPTKSSDMYTGAITITEATTFKAKAFKTGWTPSTVATATYTKTITGTVATPTFDPAPDAYTSAQSITISCDTEGATIYYTTNSDDPTENSTTYSAPVTITTTTTLKAKAYKTAWDPSDIASGDYTITITEIVATPTFSPAPGTYTSAQSVTISCDTEEATIYYTTNGGDPTEGSTPYTVPVTISATSTLKVRAFKEEWASSEIATGVYTITGTVATPTFNPEPGIYATAQDVELLCATPDAIIRYTIDGSEPTETSAVYSTAINIPEDTTLKAKAFKESSDPSETATGEYIISSEHAAGFVYADEIITMDPTPMGDPSHAPSMNMNWLNNPSDGTPPDPDPNPNPDRLLGPPDQYAVGWGPGGPKWTGTANVIVRMQKPFTHDGVVAAGPNPDYKVTDEAVLSGMGYDLVIYGLGYGFDTAFESHGQIKVYVAKEWSNDIDDWTLVSGWSGDPNGYGDDPPTYFENQDGTLTNGVPFNNGGFGAWSYTFMTIDLDNPKVIDPETGELKDIGPLTGEYNYIWFEGGTLPDEPGTHGNANFPDAFAAYSLYKDQPDPEENHPPVADAGVFQTVYPGDTVTLDASGTSDTDGDKLRWNWRQTAGTAVTLSVTDVVRAVDLETFKNALGSESGDPNWNPDADYNGDGVIGPKDFEIFKETINPTFTAFEVGPEGETLEFELTVSDDELSETDTVTIKIVYNTIASPVFAATVTDQTGGCVSKTFGVTDKGTNALGRPDYESGGDCSGWTESDTGYLTLAFDATIADSEGDDLIIYYFGAGKAEVSVSRDGMAWTYPVQFPDAVPGDDTARQTSYDFDKLGVSSARYVRIEKTGSTESVFIDAVEALYVRGAPVYAASIGDESNCVWMGPFTADNGQHATGGPDGNCSGWNGPDIAGHLTADFDQPFVDGQGDDMTIYWHGWGNVSVSVSEDSVDWTVVGGSPEGDSVARPVSYDFEEFGVTSVRHVRIIKEQGGMGVIFIDAVKGHYGIFGPVDPAGKDQTVKEGSSVTLGNSSNTSSAVYEWAQVESGATSVILSGDNEPNPIFIAPMIGADEEVTLTFQLYVDGGDSPFETVVTVVDNGITDISIDAQFTFNNPVSGKNMGMSSDGAKVVGYDFIDTSRAHGMDMTDGPDNLIYGLISFEAHKAAHGATAIVTIYLPEPAPAGYKWYKYNDTEGWFDFSRDAVSGGTGDGAEFNSDRTEVYLYITDNRDYDDDERPGIIRDPSGLGHPAGAGKGEGGDGTAGSGKGDNGECFINASAYRGSSMPVYLVFVVCTLSGIIAGIRFRMKQ